MRASANPYIVFSNVTIKLALRERFTDEKITKISGLPETHHQP